MPALPEPDAAGALESLPESLTYWQRLALISILADLAARSANKVGEDESGLSFT